VFHATFAPRLTRRYKRSSSPELEPTQYYRVGRGRKSLKIPEL
jgi:hypothetical protein